MKAIAIRFALFSAGTVVGYLIALKVLIGANILCSYGQWGAVSDYADRAGAGG